MLRSLKELLGYEILATDGEIGKVADFYFDDNEWYIRYLVADTGPWIFGKKVLIAPEALGQANWIEKKFPVNLDREQVKNCPTIDINQPVSRQDQLALHDYFHWSMYWLRPGSLPVNPVVVPLAEDANSIHNKAEELADNGVEKTDPHLRRARETLRYLADGRDGLLGKVDDLILDDATWMLHYLVLDTREGLAEGKKVLIAPFWIKRIYYESQQVYLDLERQPVLDSPAYDPQEPINRAYEEVLYDYHGRPYYWTKR